MFISYPMFIGLIILTIIMIVLIVYLTFTAKGTKNEPKMTNQLYEQIQQRQHSFDTIYDQSHSTEPFNFANDSFPTNESENDQNRTNEPYFQSQKQTVDSQNEQNQKLEEEPLRVLPYPKEINNATQNDEEIYSTSLFKRPSSTSEERSSENNTQDKSN